MDGFRQEVSHPGGGLSSYPHPRLMPDFWEFPTVSMGLGPLNAIYQARFNRYLHGRGIKDTSDQHVWAFLGDGEMDEPESLGAIGLAAREELDNLTFVINCNLQRLDGPVRGNGKIIQELESFFRGAGWNVIKVIWGREWDALLAADRDGALVNLMNQTPDGDYQTYKAEDGAFVREHFFGRDPRTRKLVEGMSDKEIWASPAAATTARSTRRSRRRGAQGPADGHPRQDHQGLDAGQPLRGPQLHPPDEEADRRGPGRVPRPALPRHPRLGAGQDPAAVLQAAAGLRRAGVHARAAPAELGGAVPRRGRSSSSSRPRTTRRSTSSAGSGKQEVATTMAFVRLLKELLKDKELGPRFVPIIPDEARTFGLDSLFSSHKIYNPARAALHLGRPRADAGLQGVRAGVILHEGINEAGSTASFTAGSLVRHPRRADDPDLHLLLDVRVPADRRRLLGRRRPDDPRLRARRHRRADDAQRRGPAARGRPLDPARGDQPRRRVLRPRVLLRARAHHQGRPAPHVRRGPGHRSAAPARRTSCTT